MVGFVAIGFVFGVFFGVFIMALMFAGRDN